MFLRVWCRSTARWLKIGFLLPVFSPAFLCGRKNWRPLAKFADQSCSVVSRASKFMCLLRLFAAIEFLLCFLIFISNPLRLRAFVVQKSVSICVHLWLIFCFPPRFGLFLKINAPQTPRVYWLKSQFDRLCCPATCIF